MSDPPGSMNARVWIAILGFAGTVVAVLGALALRGSLTPSDELAARIEALRQELQAEHEAGLVLAAEVAQLRAVVTDLAGGAPDEAPSSASGGGAWRREPSSAGAPEATRPQARGTAPPGPDVAGAADVRADVGSDVRSDGWFDADLLLDLGVPDDEVARLREIHDDHELQLLYLRDRATRENWLNRPRYHQERRALRVALRQELGDVDFDRLLWATGENNRVVLDGVLANSPAERAGLQSGDVILRYGDTAVFTPRGLQRSTATGRAGSTVAIDLLRDGRVQRVYVARGPLGTRLRPARLPPDTGW